MEEVLKSEISKIKELVEMKKDLILSILMKMKVR